MKSWQPWPLIGSCPDPLDETSTNLKNQQHQKLYFFLTPVEALCWRPNYRANTLYHLNFLCISSYISLLAARISLLQFFFLGSVHLSSSLRQHPAGCPHSVVWWRGFWSRSFLQRILRKPCLFMYIFTFCFKINMLESLKMVKRPAWNKRPLSRSKNLISVQGS